LYDLPFCRYKALKSLTPYFPTRCGMFHRRTCPLRMRSNFGVHKTRSLVVATEKCGPARANDDDLLRQTLYYSGQRRQEDYTINFKNTKPAKNLQIQFNITQLQMCIALPFPFVIDIQDSRLASRLQCMHTMRRNVSACAAQGRRHRVVLRGRRHTRLTTIDVH